MRVRVRVRTANVKDKLVLALRVCLYVRRYTNDWVNIILDICTIVVSRYVDRSSERETSQGGNGDGMSRDYIRVCS